MRAITIRQPWAWAIIHGGKDVENRSRNIAGAYRGPVAIHAGLKFADITEVQNKQIAHEVGRLSRGKLPGVGLVPARIDDPNESDYWVAQRFGNRGAIIGVVDLVDVHHATACFRQRSWELGEPQPIYYCSAWAMSSHYHIAFANPRPITPIPAKGRLGLWRPDADLVAQIEGAP